MTGKQKRIQRVIAHREKELDRRVGELGEARAAAERVETAVARAEQSLDRAAAEREAMSEQTMTASEWRDANEWVESNRRAHAAMTKELARANQHVEAKQTNVMTARRALKGVELYETRLKEEVARAEDKADQRLQDELARSRTAQKRGKA
jgi:flagellar export protein FliJ